MNPLVESIGYENSTLQENINQPSTTTKTGLLENFNKHLERTPEITTPKTKFN